jgi:hypothetical protein
MTAPTQYYVDASLGSDTGDGSKSTPWGRASGSVVQYALDTITRDPTDGDQINVKSGSTDTLGAALDVATNYGTPTQAAPLLIKGYTTDENDGGIGVIDGAATYAIYVAQADHIHLADLHMQNCGSVGDMIKLGNNCSVINCEVDNHTGNNAVKVTSYCLVAGCHIHNVASTGIVLATGSQAYRNRVLDGATNQLAWGIGVEGLGAAVIENIIHVSGSSDGIKYRTGSFICGNSIFSDGTSTGEGITQDGTVIPNLIANNMVEGFNDTGGDGFQVASSGVMYMDGNAAQDNTTDYNVTTGRIFNGDADNEELSASPFTDATNDDFSPVDTGNVKEGTYPQLIGGST